MRLSAERAPLFGAPTNAFLESQRAWLRPGMRALCVADGPGRNAIWLARAGLDVTAFDFSAVALRKASMLARAAGVRVDLRQSDIFSWDWRERPFDAVVATSIQFLSPAQRVPVFRGFREALAGGGVLLLQGYRARQSAYGTAGPAQPENLYTRQVLRESFAGWSIRLLRAHDEPVGEGLRLALVDLVAQAPR